MCNRNTLLIGGKRVKRFFLLNIRVFCRVRPLLENEINLGHKMCLLFPNDNFVEIFNHVPSSSSSNAMKTSSKVFEFDRVYEPHTPQGNQFLSNP